MDQPTDPTTMRFPVTYQKSSFFRVVHVDGIYGGVTPRGEIHMAVYSERSALPQETYFDVVDGQATPEVVTATKDGLVRELESDLVLSFNSAISLHVWLREKVEYLRQQLGVPDEEWRRLTGGQA